MLCLFCLWGHGEQTGRENAGGWALWGQAQGSEWLLVTVKGKLCSHYGGLVSL